MQVSFDVNKNARNIAERGLSFDRAADFNFETALIGADDRRSYSEGAVCRFRLSRRTLACSLFTETHNGIRVIGFRKANSREMNRYASA
jgi:uncharacterized DUF497 family protein